MRYRHKFGWSDYFGERVERERKLGERFLVRNLYESDFGGVGEGEGNVRRGAGPNTY